MPFSIVNENGDTLVKTEGLEKTKEYLKYRLTHYEYGIGGKLILQEAEIIYHPFFDKEKKAMYSVPYYSKMDYKITYEKKTVKKTFEVNNWVKGYEGWLIKMDSTEILDKKTGKTLGNFCEYRIIGMYGKFYHTIFTTGQNSVIQPWSDFDCRFINKDTLEVTEKKIIKDDLVIKYSTKIALKDTSIIVEGDSNLINPFKAVYSEFPEFTNLKGLVGYSVDYENKPFTGKLEILVQFTSNPGDIDKLTPAANGKIVLSIYKPLSSKRQNFRLNGKVLEEYEQMDTSTYHYEYNFRNGKLNGEQKLSISSKPAYTLNFSNGISHGSQKYLKNTEYGLRSSYTQRFYNNGLLDGYVMNINPKNQPELIARYNDGKLEGHYIQFDIADADFYQSPMPAFEANFINDTINGDVTTYKLGREFERIPFMKGKVTGTYYKNSTSEIKYDSNNFIIPGKKGTAVLKIELKDGWIADTIFSYYNDGRVKYKAIEDKDNKQQYIGSGYFDIYNNISIYGVADFNGKINQEDTSNINYLRMKYIPCILKNPHVGMWGAPPYIIFNEDNYGTYGFDPEDDWINAHFIFYYRNGLKFKEGEMRDNKKFGVWKYYDENGILIKEIEYLEGIDSTAQPQLNYIGKIKGSYPTGKKMMEGFVTYENNGYQCSLELDVTTEDLFYTKFYDESGKEIMKDGTGRVEDYYLNGNKRYIGSLSNYKNTGLWKFYDPTGNLSAIGEYADGKKQGRWLEGDLGGVNYIDNACSVNEALSMMKERQAKDIDITETLYEMGVEVSKSHLVLEKF